MLPCLRILRSDIFDALSLLLLSEEQRIYFQMSFELLLVLVDLMHHLSARPDAFVILPHARLGIASFSLQFFI